MSEDIFSRFRFASSATRQKGTKDKLKSRRNTLAEAINEQKEFAKELVKNSNKEWPPRQTKMFHKDGDNWRVQFRYGRRVLNLTGDPAQDDIMANDLAEVVSIFDGLLKLIGNKDPRIDDALMRVVPASRGPNPPKAAKLAKGSTRTAPV